ncbi:MAG: tRNA (guanosine(46)-N7)-methyltransferase TrmB [Bacteroidota bacterium]|jgi:tRNA (guanine-N7-)-methyltransferase
MGKAKLIKFAEFDSFSNTFNADCTNKGKWNQWFGNNNPIVLELACGKGDYTLGLARLHPHINYIGIDIKGNRLWRGAKTAIEENLCNVAFLRIPIDNIQQYFETDEVSEIWITFPDPQPQKERKRLSSPKFLNEYRKIATKDAFVNVKTDSDLFYEFTLETAAAENLEVAINIPNVYTQAEVSDILNIKTYYETLWLGMGRTIKYVKYKLNPIP